MRWTLLRGWGRWILLLRPLLMWSDTFTIIIYVIFTMLKIYLKNKTGSGKINSGRKDAKAVFWDTIDAIKWLPQTTRRKIIFSVFLCTPFWSIPSYWFQNLHLLKRLSGRYRGVSALQIWSKIDCCWRDKIGWIKRILNVINGGLFSAPVSRSIC